MAAGLEPGLPFLPGEVLLDGRTFTRPRVRFGMGTSVQVIDRSYGHLAKSQAERARERLNRRPSISTAEAAEERPVADSRPPEPIPTRGL